jgi:hypothetical protein
LYEVDDSRDRLDLDVVWGFLSTEAYWGRWRTRDIVERQIQTAWRVVGAYEQGSGEMVGFARAVSDGCARGTSSARRSSAKLGILAVPTCA